MKAQPRDPAQDPRHGDKLEFSGWTITVTERSLDGAEVRYVRSRPDKPPEGDRSQAVAVWRAWASGAKVVERAPDGLVCTVLTHGITGPCTVCRQPLGEEVHVVEGKGMGIVHPHCCKAPKHNFSKKRKPKEKVA